jgi:hypothetical protein
MRRIVVLLIPPAASPSAAREIPTASRLSRSFAPVDPSIWIAIAPRIPPVTTWNETSAFPLRQPPLRLAGLPGTTQERLRPITEGHDLYAVAAFAWHYGGELAPAALGALLGALLLGWPKKPGAHGEDYSNHLAALASTIGASPFEIASAWGVKPDSVRKKIQSAQRRRERIGADPATGRPAPFYWRIEVVDGDEALALCGDCEILPAPLDPGGEESLNAALGLLPSFASTPDTEKAFELERLAAALGERADADQLAALRRLAEEMRARSGD